ncbi:CRISPR-associated helicase Cas3' [Nonomuraea sp. NPDC048892]|uniref:CRISPR-associated helicase Cas3' n=1 Tax=Nonomuraea sp. NPDC048892 TaxID=3154624 RepID=UPI00340A1711
MKLEDLLAKSRPREKLTAHLAATLDGAIALRRRVGTVPVLDEATGGRFWAAVCLAGLCHDAGKVPDGFQAMLKGHTKSWGERHEIVSLGFLPALLEDEELLMWTATGVATHHRSLEGGRGPLQPLYGHASEAEWRDRLQPLPQDAALELAEWLLDLAQRSRLPVGHVPPRVLDVIGEARQLFDRLCQWWEMPASGHRGLAAVLLQGAVTLADHVSSAHGVLHLHQPLNDSFRPHLEDVLAGKGHRLRPHQGDAADSKGHLLLRAPTGSGKTEAGLLWAAAQATEMSSRTGGIPHVFLTLPYLASINAMALRLGRLLKNDDLVGVMHSRAASFHLAQAVCPDDEEERHAEAARKAVSRAAATRLFRETVRVGTPYQILRGVLAGPTHSSLLIDAANSIFVLDELHAYDPRRLGYILATAHLWERLGGRVAVLSATLPDALAQAFRDALDATIHLVEADTDGMRTRHRLRLRAGHLTGQEAIEEIRQRLADNEAVLVVANNVADAQHLFAELAPSVAEEAAFLLHSRFRRMDRSALEEAIGRRFGTGLDRRPGLVVATQVVEVSLDVDFDCLFTSAAPLEALLQRFGRVNRIAARPPAEVIIHPATFAPRRTGGADVADGVYERVPVELAWDILSRHDGEPVDEAHARVWLNEVYESDWGLQWRAEVEHHRHVFADAFLTFAHPFVSRDDLAELFDELFDGTEAVLDQDRDKYEADLTSIDGDRKAGRLLAERYLIPMPYWAAPMSTWEKKLGIRVLNAEYHHRSGLGRIQGPAAQTYQAGEVL